MSKLRFGPIAKFSLEAAQIDSHVDHTVARHVLGKMPQGAMRAPCVAAMRELASTIDARR